MFVWFMNEKDLFIGFYLEGYILGVFYGLLFFFCSGFLEVFKGLDSLIIWFLNIYVIVFIVNQGILIICSEFYLKVFILQWIDVLGSYRFYCFKFFIEGSEIQFCRREIEIDFVGFSVIGEVRKLINYGLESEIFYIFIVFFSF